MKRVKLLEPHFIDGAVRRGIVTVPDDFKSAYAVDVEEPKAEAPAESPKPESPKPEAERPLAETPPAPATPAAAAQPAPGGNTPKK
jgi:hypothetical protein